MLNKLSRKITKRKIQIVLGVLWLVDGMLQLQPHMFTSSFATQVIAPAGQGQPALIGSPIHFIVQTILHHPALYNAAFALIQLGLGILILWKRTARYGLRASAVWGLAIWYLGEGLGGLASGHALLLTGAPGAAVLYAILALSVMPSKAGDSHDRPAGWLPYVWVIIWMGDALLLTWSQATAKSLSSMVSGMASGAPSWLASLDERVGTWLSTTGNWFIVLLMFLSLIIGCMVLLPRWWRFAAISAGIILVLLYWMIGQSLGMYYSGLATDLNTAPLIILLGLAILGTKETGMN